MQAYETLRHIKDLHAFNIITCVRKKKLNSFSTRYYFSDDSILQINHYSSNAVASGGKKTVETAS